MSALDPPAGRCSVFGHPPRYRLIAPFQDGFLVCLTCDMVPVDGHPVHERGWSRAQYLRAQEEERRRGATE